jgi:hypothetical protein
MKYKFLSFLVVLFFNVMLFIEASACSGTYNFLGFSLKTSSGTQYVAVYSGSYPLIVEVDGSVSPIWVGLEGYATGTWTYGYTAGLNSLTNGNVTYVWDGSHTCSVNGLSVDIG